MDVFDQVKFFTEIEAPPRQAYTQEQYEKDMAKYLQNKIIGTENLSPSDLKLANELLNDLTAALGGN